AGNPALPDLVEEAEVVIAHGLRFFEPRQVLAELREHRATAFAREHGGRIERIFGRLPGHELLHGPPGEVAMRSLTSQKLALGCSEKNLPSDGHGFLIASVSTFPSPP